MPAERSATAPLSPSNGAPPDGAPSEAAPRRSIAAGRIALALAAIRSLESQASTIDRIAERIAERLLAGGTLYTAGNGGSAAEALHLAEELVGRYRSNRPPLRAVALTADPTALTCIANDFGFDEVFARPCEAFLTPRDVLVLFSTSGRSGNLVKAASVGRRKGALVIGLLGGSGGATLPQCDEAIVVGGGSASASSPETATTESATPLDSGAIQEAHQVILHAICERLERPLDGRPGASA